MESWAVEYQLENAAPEYVFEWLKSNVLEKRNLGQERDQLENTLLSRNDKLINLGLALYCDTPLVGHTLFKSNDQIIKRAALSGTSVKEKILETSWTLNDDVIPVLLDEYNQKNQPESDDLISLLKALLSNKNLPSEILEAVYERSGHFSEVDKKSRIRLVGMTVGNERLSTPYKSVLMDGYEEYRYEAVFSSAWGLFEKFPVNRMAAGFLEALSIRLVAYPYNETNTLDVIERWRSNDEIEDQVYTYVRTALVRIIGDADEFKELKNHDDVDLRKGYYANLSSVKPSDVSDGFDKDGKEFLDAAIYNDEFFRSEEVRTALRNACWDAPDERSYMDYPNSFNVQEAKLSAEHPEWFRSSWSGSLPFEEIEDADERREKRLEYLNTQVADLHKALLGDKDESQEPNVIGENSIFNDLRVELQIIGEQLGKLNKKSAFPWGWLAAGIALGLIIGSFQQGIPDQRQCLLKLTDSVMSEDDQREQRGVCT